MHYVILGAALFLSLALEGTLFNSLTVFGVKPDLLLILVIIYSLFRGSIPGAKLGFVYGLAEDLLFGNFVGLNAASKMLVGYAIGWGERRFFKDNLLVPIMSVLVGTLGFLAIYLLLFSFVSGGKYWTAFSDMVLPLCFYNTLLGSLIYQPLSRWLRPKRW